MSKWLSDAIHKAYIEPFTFEVEDRGVIPRAAGLKVTESWRGKITVNPAFKLNTLKGSAIAAQRELLQQFIEKCEEWKAAAQELLADNGEDGTQ